jgi:hypothetical protein
LLYQGSIKALSRLYQGSTQAGSIKALLPVKDSNSRGVESRRGKKDSNSRGIESRGKKIATKIATAEAFKALPLPDTAMLTYADVC